MQLADVKKMLESPVAYHRHLVPVCGSVTAALMLSQALYWTERTADPDGWFHKTCEEWEAETGLSRHEQDSARAKLRQSGVWEEDRKARNGRRRCRVNLAQLATALQNADCRNAATHTAGNRQSDPATLPESANPHCRNAATHTAGNRQSDFYKGTETTAETTAERPSPAPAPETPPGNPPPSPSPSPDAVALPGDELTRGKLLYHEHRQRFQRLFGLALGKRQLEDIQGRLGELAAAGVTPDAALLEFAEADARKALGRSRGTISPDSFFCGLQKGLDTRLEAEPPASRSEGAAPQRGALPTEPCPKTVFGFGPPPGWQPGTPRFPQWWAKQCEEQIFACYGQLFEPSKVRPETVQ